MTTSLTTMEESLGGQFPPVIRTVLTSTGPEGGGVLGLFDWERIQELSDSLRSVGFSPRYVPLHFVRPPYEVACYPILCTDGEEPAPVAILADLRTGALLGVLAETVEAALDLRAQEFVGDATFRYGLLQLAAHAIAREEGEGAYQRAKGGALPKDREWRIYRYCVQDVIVGATVVRYQASGNCLEADVFLTAEIPELEELTGARALAQFLLGEAVRCGTTMEIRFTGNVEGGSVPWALRLLAARYGLTAGGDSPSALSPRESTALLFALAGLQSDTVARIAALAAEGAVAPEQLAYGVIEGSWSPHALAVLVSSRTPGRVLTGSASPWDSLSYLDDRVVCEAAVLAERFIEMLARTSAAHPGGQSQGLVGADGIDARMIEETEDGGIDLVTEVDAGALAVRIEPRYETDTLAFPDPEDAASVIQARRLRVLLRPLTGNGLVRQMDCDLTELQKEDLPTDVRVVILVPRDVGLLDSAERSRLHNAAANAGALIVADSAPHTEIADAARLRMKSISKRLRP